MNGPGMDKVVLVFPFAQIFPLPSSLTGCTVDFWMKRILIQSPVVLHTADVTKYQRVLCNST